VLRKILGPKRKEVVEGWRKRYNEELCNLYFSPNTVRVIKLRLKWAGHVIHMGEMRSV
jgi:hypothetical protein